MGAKAETVTYTLEEVRLPIWLRAMITGGQALGYMLRGMGWLMEKGGFALQWVGYEMVMALQKLEYPEPPREKGEGRGQPGIKEDNRGKV